MKTLTLSILLALSVAASAPAQSFTTRQKNEVRKRALHPPPISNRQPQGALQRGARGGNPLQMLNPKAPPQYGTAADSLVMDETGKWRGIKLIEIVF
jgi:hypothetical protein